jgi:hypothetical protein
MLAPAFATFDGCRSVPSAAISAYLDEKPSLLGDGFFDWISNGQASNDL